MMLIVPKEDVFKVSKMIEMIPRKMTMPSSELQVK